MKILRYLTLAVLPFVFFACDNMDENEYLIYPEGETPETAPITKTQNSQAVLLEDYTGWQCTNCPAAAALLNDLSDKYGENLVAMSVHAGGFAKPAPANNNVDFRTSYGEKWNTDFGLSSYPVGVINRKKSGTEFSVKKDEWDARVSELLSSTEHVMNIDLGAVKKDGYFVVSTRITALKEISRTTLISVAVLESGIKGIQKNMDPNYGDTPIIENYTFNHVLRTNGRIDLLLRDNFSANQIHEKNYRIDIDPSWNTDNCKIIVFVTDAETGEVIQANETDIN
ncbi:MAG: Omp28-related outer membrane protein [Bacteroidales bacterium]|nr:Omp28-related outer membrane protein [Bacteroidales bacterium]